MFVLATLLYPCVLALLCAGAGLLIDRVSGSFLPGVLLPVVGAAALIGLSQLTTYSVFAAPATPYLLALIALAGFALGRRRVAALLRRGGGGDLAGSSPCRSSPTSPRWPRSCSLGVPRSPRMASFPTRPSTCSGPTS